MLRVPGAGLESGRVSESRAVRRSLVGALPLAAIVAAALGLRLARLGSESLWLDEGFSVNVAHRDLLSIPDYVARSDTHPPLYYSLLHGWIAAFGDSEAAVRSLSVVFGVLLVPVVFEIGRMLGGRLVGLTAALLAAVSPFLVRYSQETRNYALLGLLAALSFLLLLRLLDRPTRLRSWLFVIATTLLLYTHVYGLFVVLAEVAIVVLEVRAAPKGVPRRTALGRWAPVGVALGALYLPWLLVLVKQTSEEIEGGSGANLSWLEAPSGRDLLHTFETFSGSQAGFVVFLLAAAGVALAVRVAGARDPVPGRRGTIYVALLLAASTAVPFVLSFLVVPIYLNRYLMAAAVAYYLLFALMTRAVVSARLRLAIVGALTLALLAGAIAYHVVFDKNDWRSAARYIESGASAGDLVLFDVPYTQGNIFDYYASRTDLEKQWAGDVVFGEGGAAVPSERVWFVIAYPGVSSSVVPPELSSLYAKRLDRDFEGIVVRFYERKPEGAPP